MWAQCGCLRFCRGRRDKHVASIKYHLIGPRPLLLEGGEKWCYIAKACELSPHIPFSCVLVPRPHMRWRLEPKASPTVENERTVSLFSLSSGVYLCVAFGNVNSRHCRVVSCAKSNVAHLISNHCCISRALLVRSAHPHWLHPSLAQRDCSSTRLRVHHSLLPLER